MAVDAPLPLSDGVGNSVVADKNVPAADSEAAGELVAEPVVRSEPVPHSEGADADAVSLETREVDALADVDANNDDVTVSDCARVNSADLVAAGERLWLAGALSRAVEVSTAVPVIEELSRELSEGDGESVIVADGTMVTFDDADACRDQGEDFDARGDTLTDTDAVADALFNGVRVSKPLLLGDREALAETEARDELDVDTVLLALNETRTDSETTGVNEAVRLLSGLKEGPADSRGLALTNELTELHAELDGDGSAVVEAAPDSELYTEGVDRVDSYGEREKLADGELCTEIDDDGVCRGDTDVDLDRAEDEDRLGDVDDETDTLSVAAADEERRNEREIVADFDVNKDADVVSL